jgi:transcriptional regulator with XRE-family HTH domain
VEALDAEHLPFPGWLVDQLRQRGWRAVELARRLGVPSGTVSRWLSGERTPTARSCDRLAEILGVDADLVLTTAGHRPASRPIPPSDSRDRIITLIERLDMSPAQAAGLEAMLRAWLDEQHAAAARRPSRS